MGIVHKNMSIEAQANEVARVKKYESGVIKDPITVSPDMTIRQVLELTRSRGISGVPVVVGKKVVGIVTHRDLRFEEKLDAPVSSVMTPKERLVTVRENAPKSEVLGLLHKHRIEKVLVVERRSRARRHDHGEGLPEGHGIPARLRRMSAVACASARRSAPPRTPSIASLRFVKPAWTWSSSTPRTGTRAASSRWSARSRTSGRTSRSSAATSPRPRRARALVGCGSGRREGRHRPRLHLHHAYRRGCRCAADLRRFERCGSARADRCPAHLRRRHPLLRRHRQGARGRRALRDDRQPVRGHARVAGRSRAVPGRELQVLSRHGLARRDGRAPRLRGSLFPGRASRAREARAGGRRRPRALQGQRGADPPAAGRRSARIDGVHGQPQRRRTCVPSRTLCESRMRACARATFTT